MTLSFSAVVRPPRHVIGSLAALDPATLFYTPAYAAARAAVGEVPCVFVLEGGTGMVAGCLGFLRGNFLMRTLEISSAFLAASRRTRLPGEPRALPGPCR
jgi:hypothetical protein